MVNGDIRDICMEAVSKMEGDRLKMLATLLAANLEGKQIILIQQNMSDGKTIKFQYQFVQGELAIKTMDDEMAAALGNIVEGAAIGDPITSEMIELGEMALARAKGTDKPKDENDET